MYEIMFTICNIVPVTQRNPSISKIGNKLKFWEYNSIKQYIKMTPHNADL